MKIMNCLVKSILVGALFAVVGCATQSKNALQAPLAPLAGNIEVKLIAVSGTVRLFSLARNGTRYAGVETRGHTAAGRNAGGHGLVHGQERSGG